VGVAIAGAAIGAIGTAIKEASTYQTTLAKVQNAAHLTAAETKAMGQTIMTASIGTTASANQMAAALAPVAGEIETVTGKTLTAADATHVLTAGWDLSESTGASYTSSVKNIVDTLMAYQFNTDQAARVSNVFFEASQQLGIGSDTYGRMLQRLQPRITGMGLSIEQVTGIVREATVGIKELGIQGVGSGIRALSQVGTVLQRLQSPAAGAQKMLAALGITMTDSSGKFIGYTQVISKLHDVYERLPATVAKGSTEITKASMLTSMFGQQSNIAKILIIGNTTALLANEKALGLNGTAAAAALNIQQQLNGQIDHIKASISTAVTAIGGAFLPILQQMLAPLVSAADAIARWSAANPDLAAKILIVVGAVSGLIAGMLVLGPLIGTIATALGLVASPILAIGAAILGALAYFGLLGTGAQSAADSVLKAIQGAVPAIIAQLGKWATAFTTWARDTAIPAIVAAIGKIIDAGVAWLGDGSVLARIGDQLAKWAAAFTTWATDTAIPAALAAVGKIVDAVVAWVGDGSNIARIADQLTKWAAAFVAWAFPAAAELILELGAAIVANAPKIIEFMYTVASNIITGIVQGLMSNPQALVVGITALFALRAVVMAVTAAGEAAGALYAAALAAAKAIQAAIIAWWTGSAVASGAAAAASGAADAVAYEGAWAGTMAGFKPAMIAMGSNAGGAMVGGLASKASAIAAAFIPAALITAAAVLVVGTVKDIIVNGLNDQQKGIGANIANEVAAGNITGLKQSADALKQGMGSLRANQKSEQGPTAFLDSMYGITDAQVAQLQAQLDAVENVLGGYKGDVAAVTAATTAQLTTAASSVKSQMQAMSDGVLTGIPLNQAAYTALQNQLAILNAELVKRQALGLGAMTPAVATAMDKMRGALTTGVQLAVDGGQGVLAVGLAAMYTKLSTLTSFSPAAATAMSNMRTSLEDGIAKAMAAGNLKLAAGLKIMLDQWNAFQGAISGVAVGPTHGRATAPGAMPGTTISKNSAEAARMRAAAAKEDKKIRDAADAAYLLAHPGSTIHTPLPGSAGAAGGGGAAAGITSPTPAQSPLVAADKLALVQAQTALIKAQTAAVGTAADSPAAMAVAGFAAAVTTATDKVKTDSANATIIYDKEKVAAAERAVSAAKNAAARAAAETRLAQSDNALATAQQNLVLVQAQIADTAAKSGLTSATQQAKAQAALTASTTAVQMAQERLAVAENTLANAKTAAAQMSAQIAVQSAEATLTKAQAAEAAAQAVINAAAGTAAGAAAGAAAAGGINVVGGTAGGFATTVGTAVGTAAAAAIATALPTDPTGAISAGTAQQQFAFTNALASFATILGNATSSGIPLTFGGSTVGLLGGPGRAPGMASGAIPIGAAPVFNIYLDGQVIKGVVTRMVAGDARSLAGPAYAGSPY